MTCEVVRERLIDFLYGELAPAEKQAFQTHLAGCQACSKEVESLGGVLGQARATLRAAVAAEAPPARVRAAVLQAAAEAARASAGAARAAGEGSAAAAQAGAAAAGRRPKPQGQRGGEAGGGGSFWAWLRQPWVGPAFAAASVIAVFVMARNVIMRPEPMKEVAPVSAPAAVGQDKGTAAAPAEAKGKADEGQMPAEPRGEAARFASEPAAKPMPPAATPSAPPARRSAPRPRAVSLAPPSAERDLGRGASSGRFAAPPPPERAAREKNRVVADDLLEAKRAADVPRPTPARLDADEATRARSGAANTAREAEASKMETVAGSAAPGGPALRDRQQLDMNEGYGVRGGAGAGSTAPSAAPSPPRPSKPAAVQPAPPAPAPTSAPAPAAPPSMAQESAEAAPPVAAERSERRVMKAKKAAGPLSLDELVKEAESAFAAGRWADAERHYAELVRRFPDATKVPAWRGRLRAAKEAAARR